MENREGFTTGSAVSAAAAAALAVLLAGESSEQVTIPLPPDENGVIPGTRLPVPVRFCERIANNGTAFGYAGVIKDAGDDPDVTDGMLFTAHVARNAAHIPPAMREESCAPLNLGNGITLYAGPGIGVATLPGLPIAVGEMAVNPAPRRQIAAALLEVAGLWGYHGQIHCRLAALGGKTRAKQTLNARLGIIGGISILGTKGTVKAFSAEAWKSAISRALDVAAGMKCGAVCLTTGRRSEQAMRALYPDLPEQAFVQAADHAGYALAEAARHGFSRIAWGCFPGKLLKLAQGLAWTHAHSSSTDFTLFSRLCAEAGVPEAQARAAALYPTITGALEAIRAFSPALYADVISRMTEAAADAARDMALRGVEESGRVEVTVRAFDLRGTLLATVTRPPHASSPVRSTHGN